MHSLQDSEFRSEAALWRPQDPLSFVTPLAPLWHHIQLKSVEPESITLSFYWVQMLMQESFSWGIPLGGIMSPLHLYTVLRLSMQNTMNTAVNTMRNTCSVVQDLTSHVCYVSATWHKQYGAGNFSNFADERPSGSSLISFCAHLFCRDKKKDCGYFQPMHFWWPIWYGTGQVRPLEVHTAAHRWRSTHETLKTAYVKLSCDSFLCYATSVWQRELERTGLGMDH